MSNAEHNGKTNNESIKDATTEMAGNGDVWHFRGTEKTNLQQKDTVQNVVQESHQQSSPDKNVSEVRSEEKIPENDAALADKESTLETNQDSGQKQLGNVQHANREENKTHESEDGTNVERRPVFEEDQPNPKGEEDKENPGVVQVNNSEICSSTNEKYNSEETENNNGILETEICDTDSNQCNRSATQRNEIDNSKGARPKANMKKPGIDRLYGGDGSDKPSKKEKKAAEKEKCNRRSDRFKKERCEDLPDESERYEYFWQNPSVFSQWYPSEFFVDGLTYNCAEQFMMHQKAILMEDFENAEIVMSLSEPREIKNVGRHVKNFNQDLWNKNCVEIVKKGNIAKFSQNEKMKEKLFETFPKTLVEASPLDRVWGIGLSKKDKRAWNRQTWEGQNLLGYILTDVREELMRDAGKNTGNDCSNSDQSLPKLDEPNCSINVAADDQEFTETDNSQTPHQDEELIKPGDSNITPNEEVSEPDSKPDTPN